MLWPIVTCIGFISQFLGRGFSVFFLIFVSFLSAFRYYVGSDYSNYVILYELSVSGESFVPVEFSFIYFSRLLEDYGFNFQALILFYALSTYLFIYLGVRKYSVRYAGAAVITFLVYVVFYFPSLSVMRQALASAVCFWGVLTFLEDRKYISFVFVCILASFIHFGALIFIFTVVFMKFRLPNYLYFLIFLMSVLLGVTVFKDLVLSSVSYIGFDYKGHLLKSEFTSGSSIFYVNTIVLSFVFFIFLFYCGSKIDGVRVYLINVVFFILIVRCLSFEFIILNRLSIYFTLFVPLFVHLFFYVRLNRVSRFIFLVAVFMLMIFSDFVRMNKDYSYYQYSINLCLYGNPCPFVIWGGDE